MRFTAMRAGNEWQSGRTRRFGAGAYETTVRGFTLIELMIVVSIIMILAGIAAVHYERSYDRAKEATLHQDLAIMRKAINDYTGDKEAAPNTLDDLVTEHYLSKIPDDPITRAPNWNVDSNSCADAVMSPDQLAGGICDVHSASDAVSPFEGTPYSSW